jgi:hypothetical protein
VTTHGAEQAYELVLQRAGSFPRDVVTRRTIEETRSGTGSWGRHDPPGGLMDGLALGEPPLDTDRDGMPDAWERQHELDPGNPADANRTVPDGRHQGYTYIESYINELADRIAGGR